MKQKQIQNTLFNLLKDSDTKVNVKALSKIWKAKDMEPAEFAMSLGKVFQDGKTGATEGLNKMLFNDFGGNKLSPSAKRDIREVLPPSKIISIKTPETLNRNLDKKYINLYDRAEINKRKLIQKMSGKGLEPSVDIQYIDPKEFSRLSVDEKAKVLIETQKNNKLVSSQLHWKKELSGYVNVDYDFGKLLDKEEQGLLSEHDITKLEEYKRKSKKFLGKKRYIKVVEKRNTRIEKIYDIKNFNGTYSKANRKAHQKIKGVKTVN